MSMVFILALLHGVPVFLFGIRARSRTILTILALISGAIALSTGSARYNGADLTAVVVAWVLGMLVLNSIVPAKPRDIEAERILAAQRKAYDRKFVSAVFALWLAFVGILGSVIYYNNNYGPCSDGELRKQQVTRQQCKINEEIKACQAGDLTACRGIEARRLQHRESREPEYRE